MLLSVSGALSEESASLSVSIIQCLFACTYEYLHVVYAYRLLASLHTDQ